MGRDDGLPPDGRRRAARLHRNARAARPDVLGHSMGGKMAMAFALMNPAAGRSIDRRRRRAGGVCRPAVDLRRGDACDRRCTRPPAVTKCAAPRRPAARRRSRLPDAEPRDARRPLRLAHQPAGIAASIPAVSGLPVARCGRLRFNRPAARSCGRAVDYVPRATATVFEPMFTQPRVDVIVRPATGSTPARASRGVSRSGAARAAARRTGRRRAGLNRFQQETTSWQRT